MTTSFEIQCGPPSEFSKQQHEKFAQLVRCGEQVVPNVLDDNIRHAGLLVFLLKDGRLVGTAALKRPQLGYRARIARNSGADIPEPQFPFELGYIFIEPSARGQGQSVELVANAVGWASRSGMFATTQAGNGKMISGLKKHGFQTIGRTYSSTDGKRKLQLLTRPGA